MLDKGETIVTKKKKKKRYGPWPQRALSIEGKRNIKHIIPQKTCKIAPVSTTTNRSMWLWEAITGQLALVRGLSEVFP